MIEKELPREPIQMVRAGLMDHHILPIETEPRDTPVRGRSGAFTAEPLPAYYPQEKHGGQTVPRMQGESKD